MIRVFDVIISAFGLLLSIPVFCVILYLAYRDTGSPIFSQSRLGIHQKPFVLYKFRTMPIDTESVATHMIDGNIISPFGRFLRNTKLDEIPQLWNVLKGDMSLVGPRPNLASQHELIAERQKRGVYNYKPGITGLAQIQGIDMSTPEMLSDIDAAMLKQFSIFSYFQYLCMTLLGKGRGDKVS